MEPIRSNVANCQNPSLHIRTRVSYELFYDVKPQIDYKIFQAHFNSQLTDEEFVNAMFKPQKYVNDKHAELLGATITIEDPAQIHVCTGSRV